MFLRDYLIDKNWLGYYLILMICKIGVFTAGQHNDIIR